MIERRVVTQIKRVQRMEETLFMTQKLIVEQGYEAQQGQ